MIMQNKAEISELQWRDLSAENVYHIAHLEDEARSEPLSSLSNMELRALSWLNDQAIINMRQREPTENFQQWLELQLITTGATARGIAEAARIRECDFSKLRHTPGRRPIARTIGRIANALADAQGLTEDERLALIEDASQFRFR